ncbi:MAG TPA: heme-binding domain-containing protein [Candidatus Krumholzibacteria bacterium]|nr:heme-binding domain-containing protein [Candidatus Krumholzibacteria bacterium]
MLKVIRVTFFSLVGVFLLIQLVPYGRDHTNPAHKVEPNWDKPSTRALAKRACYDCHSNETVWPWYSHVAPVSWQVMSDVVKGRHEMNFSEWDKPQDEADHAAKMVTRGKMPLPKYLLLHPEARLSQAEKDSLVSGLTLTIGADKGAKPKKSVYGDEINE